MFFSLPGLMELRLYVRNAIDEIPQGPSKVSRIDGWSNGRVTGTDRSEVVIASHLLSRHIHVTSHGLTWALFS